MMPIISLDLDATLARRIIAEQRSLDESGIAPGISLGDTIERLLRIALQDPVDDASAASRRERQAAEQEEAFSWKKASTEVTEKGRAGNRFGHFVGPAIAKELGARQPKPGANEFTLGNRRITIRSARRTTFTVGCLATMLERLDEVYAAFEQAEEGRFTVWKLPAEAFAAAGRDNGRGVIMVPRAAFEKSGTRVGDYVLDLSELD